MMLKANSPVQHKSDMKKGRLSIPELIQMQDGDLQFKKLGL